MAQSRAIALHSQTSVVGLIRLLTIFELGEVTDQGLAARLAQALRDMKITGGFFSQDRPLVELLKQKANKNYENLNGALELVLY
jgi:hypothetical protein